MRITYTATEIRGKEIFGKKAQGRWPESSRIAKETLKAVIEEAILPLGIAKSYTLINSSEFPYPHEKPNPYNLKEFFAEKDVNKIIQEIELLYSSLNEKGNTLAQWYSNNHHGQGIWVARLVDPQNQVIPLWEREVNVEQALAYRGMGSHTIYL